MRIDATPSLMASALSALHRGERQMLQAAQPILAGDIDAMPSSLVDLELAKITHALGVKLARTADETLQSTIDILA